MNDIHTESQDEAIRICHELIREKGVSLFRGQSRDWPTMQPSLFRKTGKEYEKAIVAFEKFHEWANAVPQMGVYATSKDAITAIAQHYGIPTTFLDITRSPEVAALFSMSEPGTANDGGKGVIYCYRRSSLKELPGARLVEIDVANLWRLQAQEGLFLELSSQTTASALREHAIRIHYPISELSSEDRVRLYPVRKSALESVLDQWFYRSEVERLTDGFGQGTRTILTKRHSYPGAFFRRMIPNLSPEWFGLHAGWFIPDAEPESVLRSSRTVCIQIPKEMEFADAVSCSRDAVSDSILADDLSSEILTFEINGDDIEREVLNSCSKIINRVWDGIRVLPYTAEEKTSCIALSATALVMRVRWGDDLNKSLETYLGETELVEIAPVGGHIEAGLVNKKALDDAFDPECQSVLSSYFRRLFQSDKKEFMNYVVEPWAIFDFDRFKSLFVEQFIPSAVDAYWKEDLSLYDGAMGCTWSISFNPALLAYITRAHYRFNSPLAHEEDPERVVYVPRGISLSELEEQFVYCLGKVMEDGEPFQLRFHGYHGDHREIWEIPEAIAYCKAIVEMSGISVLEVATSFRAPEDVRNPFDRSGLGAFEIWAIAKNRLSDINGKSIDDLRPLFDELFDLLPYANADLEKRFEKYSS